MVHCLSLPLSETHNLASGAGHVLPGKIPNPADVILTMPHGF